VAGFLHDGVQYGCLCAKVRLHSINLTISDLFSALLVDQTSLLEDLHRSFVPPCVVHHKLDLFLPSGVHGVLGPSHFWLLATMVC
jgi:hypothetical protein